MILLIKLCLTLFVICEPSLVLGDCTVEVKRATWNFNYGSDEEIPGVLTVQECRNLCLNDPENCRGYTHTTNEVVGYCYKFKELTGMRECSTCSSGTTPEYFEGACPFNTEDELGEENTDSAEACWQKCFETQGCSSFTWYDSSTPFENICFLFSRCQDVKVCSGCHSGRVNCINSPQCFDYKLLNEESRSIHTETTSPNYHYDYQTAHMSPAWDGDGYYRMVPPAGKVIPEEDHGVNHCSTKWPGYLKSGSHPDVVGQEVDRTVYLSGQSCKREIKITKCPGDYFVYHLVDVCSGSRYCATSEN